MSCEGKSTIFLAAATLIGIEVAVWTRFDLLPPKTWVWVTGPVLCAAHVLVLGLWSWSWLLFWKHTLRKRGGFRLAVVVALCPRIVSAVALVGTAVMDVLLLVLRKAVDSSSLSFLPATWVGAGETTAVRARFCHFLLGLGRARGREGCGFCVAVAAAYGARRARHPPATLHNCAS